MLIGIDIVSWLLKHSSEHSVHGPSGVFLSLSWYISSAHYFILINTQNSGLEYLLKMICRIQSLLLLILPPFHFKYKQNN